MHPRDHAYKDIVTDDDLLRLIHAMNASPIDVYHTQVCEDPYCMCSGPSWSTKILAEVWHETLPHHAAEIAPRIGTSDPSVPGFANPTMLKP
jgi:hypothetical protein